MWGLSPGTVKNMAAEGHIDAKKIGPAWAIDAEQPTPVRRPGRVEYWRGHDEQQLRLFDASQSRPGDTPETIRERVQQAEQQLAEEQTEEQAADPPEAPERDETAVQADDPPAVAAPDPAPPALEPDPAPLEDVDLEYFAQLYREATDWNGLDETAADERIRGVLRAYEFAEGDQERLLALIKQEAGNDDEKSDDPIETD